MLVDVLLLKKATIFKNVHRMSIWFLALKPCTVLPQMLDQHVEQIEKPKKDKIKLVDISFPDIEKFDFLPEPRVEGLQSICFNHGRLLEILFFLCGSLYSR